MSNAIIARLGLDSGDFKRGLDQSAAALQGANRKMTQSAKERGAAAESVWEREKKVEAQVQSLAGKLTAAASAGDAMTASLGALAESLNLSIAGAGMAALGIGLLDQLLKAKKAVEEFNAAVEAIGVDRGAPNFGSLQQYEARITAITDKLKELQAQKGAFASAMEFISSAHILGGEGYDAVIAQKDQQVAQLLAELEKARANVAAKSAVETQAMQAEAGGDKAGAELIRNRAKYEELIGAAIKAQNPALVEQLKLQQQLAEEAIRKKAAEEQGKDTEANMAAEAKAALERKKTAEEAEKAGRDTEMNMAAEARKFLEQRKKEEDEAAQQGRATELQMHEEAMKHLEKQRKARLDAAEESAAAARASIAARTSERNDRLQQRVGEILNPGSRADARREKRRTDRAFRRALREEDLAERGGKARADVKGSDLFGPSMKDLGGDSASMGAQLDASQMAADIKTIRENLKAADV